MAESTTELTDALQRFLQPDNLEYVLEVEAEVQAKATELSNYRPEHKSFSLRYKPETYMLPILLGEHLGLSKEDVRPAIVASAAIRIFMSYADDLIDDEHIDPQLLIRPFVDGLTRINVHGMREPAVCHALGTIIYEVLRQRSLDMSLVIEDAEKLEQKFYEAHKMKDPEQVLEVSGSLSTQFCFTLIGVGMNLSIDFVGKLERVGYDLGTYLQLADDLVDIDKDRATNQPNYMATILPGVRETILENAKRKAMQTLDILSEGMKKDILRLLCITPLLPEETPNAIYVRTAKKTITT